MKASEACTRFLAGELLVVGEFRGGRAIRSDYVDKKSGLKIPRLLVVYVVECSMGGAFGVAKITALAPDGATEPEQVTIPLEKGKRYVFPIQTVDPKNDLVTAWIGKKEPLPLEEDEPGGGPVTAPQGAATGPALA
ncbi:MAG: hypothetical protein ACFUZC_23730 [Chthoniobacteraceae bacterium]